MPTLRVHFDVPAQSAATLIYGDYLYEVAKVSTGEVILAKDGVTAAQPYDDVFFETGEAYSFTMGRRGVADYYASETRWAYSDDAGPTLCLRDPVVGDVRTGKVWQAFHMNDSAVTRRTQSGFTWTSTDPWDQDENFHSLAGVSTRNTITHPWTATHWVNDTYKNDGVYCTTHADYCPAGNWALNGGNVLAVLSPDVDWQGEDWVTNSGIDHHQVEELAGLKIGSNTGWMWERADPGAEGQLVTIFQTLIGHKYPALKAYLATLGEAVFVIRQYKEDSIAGRGSHILIKSWVPGGSVRHTGDLMPRTALLFPGACHPLLGTENTYRVGTLSWPGVPIGELVGSLQGMVGHDPYVLSANGKVAKIPDGHGFYRMLQSGDTFVNVEVAKLDIKDELTAFLASNNFDMASLGKRRPTTSGYWNKAVFVQSEGHKLSYDMFERTLSADADLSYFEVKNNAAGRQVKVRKDMSLSDHVSDSVIVSWTHSVHGRQSLTLDWYHNPQVQNGVSMASPLIRSKGSSGLFVKNFKAKYMEVESLDACDGGATDDRLLAAERAGKKVTSEQPLKAAGEEWFICKGNKLIKN